MTNYEAIRVERPADHVARVVLNRPAAANALSSTLLSELEDAVTAIAADDGVHAWILTGAPRFDGRGWFSAGVDVKEVLSGATEPFERGLELAARIDEMPIPSIAAIAGVCTTGALELALACDLRVVSHDARLSDWHLRRTGLGIGAWGMAARLTRLVGVDKAKELLLLGPEVSGEEAVRIGLANHSVPSEDVGQTALSWAMTIAALPRKGVRTTMTYLDLQADRTKVDAIALGGRMPDIANIRLRPFADAAARIIRETENDHEE